MNEQQEGDIESLLNRLAKVDWSRKPATVADLEEFAAVIELALELIQSQGQMIKQLQLAVWQASNE